MQRDWRLVGAWALILALAAVALWLLVLAPDDDGAAIEPTPTPTTTTPAPSPSPSANGPTPTPTATAVESPSPDYTPSALPTGEDFQQVVQTIFDIRHDAFTMGDPTILGEVYDSRCDCSTRDQESIQRFVDEGLTYTGGVPTVVDVEIVTEGDGGGPHDVFIDATVEFSASRTLDADDEAVRSTDSTRAVIGMVLLRNQRADQRWVALAVEVTERIHR